MDARYRFAVRFRVPTRSPVTVTPEHFETQLRYPAPPPGESGWLLFRDALWRGELNAPEHFRERVDGWLDVPVEGVEFRAFETDPAYLEAFRAAIAEDLGRFRAADVESVLGKYLGSRIEVTETDSLNADDA